ncbi:hypothetical protein Q7C36_013906 [Tachysurus vachellii]|uniref:Ig-like domain-containing protein n=1 Tax=Tachysurus vachellii TaxID=175792 RepID=A0AA88MM04_TACVA|nr:hypothetical protein Q7C36_013906 [Tachysurus vachellii]
MMMLMWITLVLFRQTGSAQKNVLHQPNSVITAASGENVTLQCIRTNKKSTDPIIWYKQFKSPRFSVENLKESCNLKINNMEPSDEAVYYCGIKIFTIQFGKGTFLSVKLSFIYLFIFWIVIIIRVLDSVPAGASVTLQCSVLSESRAAELQVLWFRAAPPQSHPQIIYTHHNSSHQCESSSSTHTCVYNVSKNILSLSDTGTYYCAVLLCGKIILGNGTPVQMENFAASYNPVVMCLGTALVMCGILISVQTVLLCKRKNGPQHRGEFFLLCLFPQVNYAVELNYAALHYIERKIKRMRGNRGPSQNSVYTEVKYSTISHLK